MTQGLESNERSTWWVLFCKTRSIASILSSTNELVMYIFILPTVSSNNNLKNTYRSHLLSTYTVLYINPKIYSPDNHIITFCMKDLRLRENEWLAQSCAVILIPKLSLNPVPPDFEDHIIKRDIRQASYFSSEFIKIIKIMLLCSKCNLIQVFGSLLRIAVFQVCVSYS